MNTNFLHFYRLSLFPALAILCILSCGKQPVKIFELSSPQKKINLIISWDGTLSAAITGENRKLLEIKNITLAAEKADYPDKKDILSVGNILSGEFTVKPAIPVKRAVIKDEYRELTLSFGKNSSVIFRVYDNAAAYRFVLHQPDSAIIEDENVEFETIPGCELIYQNESSFQSPRESAYQRNQLSSVSRSSMIPSPALIKTPDGTSLMISESDREDYPGLWLKKTSSASLRGIFPHVVKSTGKKKKPDFITKRESYIARTSGNRQFPWRVISVFRGDAEIADSHITASLSRHADRREYSWVKPGKAAWDWWNQHNITGVNFKPGINMETYRSYIDFAAKSGIEYVLIDEGWSPKDSILQPVTGLDIKELASYAAKKNVDIILWVYWKNLNGKAEEALSLYERWGVKGIKADFMERDDQEMTGFFYRIAALSAKHHLIADFHGAVIPPGLSSLYPNVLTCEGVKGLEHNKWSANCNPDNDVYIPFMRMFTGAVDYTPGSMSNRNLKDFKPDYNSPSSIGTRVHQIAQFIVYESPLQTMADGPLRYEKESDCLKFISKIPTTWDDTRILSAEIGEYICTARKKESSWFIGALTNGKERNLVIDFSFLKKNRSYTATIFQDGSRAESNAEDFAKKTIKVYCDTKIGIKLVPGGGWACSLTPD